MSSAPKHSSKSIAGTIHDPELKKLAVDFAEEEQDHVDLIKELLEREPLPHQDWARDCGSGRPSRNDDSHGEVCGGLGCRP